MIEGKDLKAIIRECAKRGVAELKIGDFHIKFGSVEDIQAPKAKSEIKAPSKAVLKAAENQALVAENAEHNENMLANLQLEDPVAFEKMLIEGELEEDGKKTYD